MNFILLKDILKEKVKSGKLKYSQGRIYLFISFVSFYTCLSIITFKGIFNSSDIDLNSFEIVIDSLKWSLALFASYTLGGKTISAAKNILNKKEDGE